jgi:hypothetical protein
MPSPIFAHKGWEIQHNRSSYGLRAVETPEPAAPISRHDSQISPIALGAIYDGTGDAIDDDEPSDFSTAVTIAAVEGKFLECDHSAIRRNLREWAQSAAIHLQALVVLYDPPGARELCDAIAAIENAMRAPANSAARQAAADRLTEISARLNEIGIPLRAADEHRRAEYRRNRQAKRVDHEADKRAEGAYFDAIRRDAIAQAELRERNRVARLKATKEELRQEAERRAVKRAEREAARLAQWPRRALPGAS